MIKRIITVLSKKLAMARSKDKPTPNWEDIRKVLNQTAEIQARAAKQQAAWQASWEAQRAQEHKEREHEREQEHKERERERAHERQEERRRFAAWEASMNRVLKDMGVRVGGLTNNVGKIAEEYFFNALKNKKTITINGARFTNNNVLADKRFKKQKKSMQCDLVLTNTRYLAIVEVKFYLHPDDVARFDTKLRQVLPEVLPAKYQHLQLIPVIGCLGLSLKAKEDAQERGFALLRQYGETARFESEHLRLRPLSIRKQD